MSDPRICNDKDLVELCPDLDLWLKPDSKITITVTLPSIRSQTVGGQLLSISTWEVMEKLKKKIKPNKFKVLKIIKSNTDFIRFEAESDSQINLNLIESHLNRVSLKLSGFSEHLNVKTAKVKTGATRHEWESYFRDNPHMNEMKPGHRPDTIHLQSLPVKWFGGDRPRPNLLVKCLSTFGDIRRFHIPILDTNQEEETFKIFTFNESLTFDAYVQFRDYIGFVKAMDALRGMKLVKKLSQLNNQKTQYLEYDIIVDFDKTKHLSDKAIKKRRLTREYGIKSAVDLKNLREETKKQRQKYQYRIHFLQNRKQSAKYALKYLIGLAENKAIVRNKVEEAKQADIKIKQRLLLEEKKLREKLLERRREQLRTQSKGKLKSVANVTAHLVNTNNHNHYHSNHCSNHLIESAVNPRISSFNSVNSSDHPFIGHNHNHNRYQYYDQINRRTAAALYKNHKKGCKFYKPKSIVVNNNFNKQF